MSAPSQNSELDGAETTTCTLELTLSYVPTYTHTHTQIVHSFQTLWLNTQACNTSL